MKRKSLVLNVILFLITLVTAIFLVYVNKVCGEVEIITEKTPTINEIVEKNETTLAFLQNKPSEEEVNIKMEEEIDTEENFVFSHANLVKELCEYFDLNESLIYGVIEQESQFCHEVTSSAGAKGIMQLVDVTFNWMKRELQNYPYWYEKIENKGIWDIEANLICGVFHLYYLRETYKENSIHFELTAYNRGVQGSRNWYKSRGTYRSKYSESVLRKMEKYAKEKDNENSL